MRVLIAFDKFKDALSAARACEVAARALSSSGSPERLDLCPLSDGGEGFAEILTQAAEGQTTRATVAGPRGNLLAAAFGRVPVRAIPLGARSLLGPAPADSDGFIAAIEMAAASGLALLPGPMRDPFKTTTQGTGQLIRAAADSGVRAVVLGVGGSATHDLGLGALGALGIRFYTESGSELNPLVPADWSRLRRIGGGLHPPLPPILIACDVENPLVGPDGALAVYGKQKGLLPADAAGLEAETARVAAKMCAHFGKSAELMKRPGAGAAGGIAFGLMAGADAALLPGFELVYSWLGLEERLAAADLVITGEGRFDASSLSGKGPGTLVRRALALGKTVHVFAGQVDLPADIAGLQVHAVTPPGTPLGEALAKTPELLFQTVERTFRSG